MTYPVITDHCLSSWKETSKPKSGKIKDDSKSGLSSNILLQPLHNTQKLVEYPYGMNTNYQSDYEFHESIPRFPDDLKIIDKKICNDIFDILAHSEIPLNSDRLYKQYLRRLRESKNLHFMPYCYFVQFITSHSHVFTIDHQGIVSNRGFGFRRGMVYLACIIRQNESKNHNGAKLLDIYNEVAGLPMYHSAEAWTDQYFWTSTPSYEFLTQFLLCNNQIYNVNFNGGIFVQIKRSALKVPSLWDSTLLPLIIHYKATSLKNTTSINRLDMVPLWDRSRTLHLKGVIVKSKTEHNATAQITNGLFMGKEVYIMGKHIDINEDMRDFLPEGTKVLMRVHYTFFYKCDFRCISLNKI